MNDTFAETHIYTRDLRRILNSGGTNHCNGPIPANSASFLQANCPLPKKRSKRPSVGIVVRLGHHLARISVSFRRQLNKGTRNTQMFFSGFFFSPSLCRLRRLRNAPLCRLFFLGQEKMGPAEFSSEWFEKRSKKSKQMGKLVQWEWRSSSLTSKKTPPRRGLCRHD